MATIKLSDYECRKDMLPKVCMFCGAPATTRVRRQFSWTPGWVWILILVNLIVLAVVAMLVTKKMPVRVPTCDEHEGHWRRKNTVIGLTFLAVAVLCVLGIVYATQQVGPGGDDVTGWVCAGCGVLFLAWLIMAAVMGTRGVRAVHITEDTIKLTGVNEDFVEALREERARYRDDAGRERYGDERDDYDDEIIDEPRPRRRVRDDRDDRDDHD